MSWKFNKKKEQERQAAIAAAAGAKYDVAHGIDPTPGIQSYQRGFTVSKKNKQYQESYDELERIYAEVVKEAGGTPDWGAYKPLPKQEYPNRQKYDQYVKDALGAYDYAIGEDGRLTKLAQNKPVESAPEPEPAGVTLEELFAEDGETL